MNDLTKHILDLNDPKKAGLAIETNRRDYLSEPLMPSRTLDILQMIRDRQNRARDEE